MATTTASQNQDVRVRAPLSSVPLPREQFEPLRDAPAPCHAPCCAPLANDQDASTPRPTSFCFCSPSSPAASVAAATPATLERPALNRNVASHQSISSGKSLYSTGTDGSCNTQSEDGSTTGMPEFGDLVDASTFEQILEMDDDEDEREFSRSIVYDFFTQAENTFQQMDSNLESRNLSQLSSLGHFLKGSSATLGLTKVKDSCEKIQHFGAHKDETGTHDVPDDDTCLRNCRRTIEQAKAEYHEVEAVLRRFYRDEGSTT